MATEVPSPELTSSPPVQGWDSQARMATARVAGAQAAPGEFAGAELRRGQPAQRRSGRAAFAQARMAAGLGAGPARTASEAAPPDAEPLAPSAAAPQGHWLEVRDCRVAGHVLPLVLLHPRFGIAVCGGPVEAAALVRQRLERARFPAIYPGTLPVLRLPGADSAVERAFAAGPPLALPGGDAWVAMARQALETEVSPPCRPGSASGPGGGASGTSCCWPAAWPSCCSAPPASAWRCCCRSRPRRRWRRGRSRPQRRHPPGRRPSPPRRRPWPAWRPRRHRRARPCGRRWSRRRRPCAPRRRPRP
ncbi:hypothetical protein ACFQY5_06030 [Paeniroseomonas aquatica]|uniref:hypothetical protein n=1 Tax=Paeniroseomonas aquatica TaxID=373043 RepID=UPI0036196326